MMRPIDLPIFNLDNMQKLIIMSATIDNAFTEFLGGRKKIIKMVSNKKYGLVAKITTKLKPRSFPENTILYGSYDPLPNVEKLTEINKDNVSTLPNTTRFQTQFNLVAGFNPPCDIQWIHANYKVGPRKCTNYPYVFIGDRG